MKFEPKLNDKLIENKFLAVSTHTGGEITRIVMDGFPEPQGNTMIEKKNYLIENYDHYRKSLMLEPRGHKNMFGALFTEPVNKEAAFGVIFMDTGGYLNMCGHGTIGSVTAAIETGIVPCVEPVTEVTFDAPAGIIRTKAQVENGSVKSVTLTNVPAFLYKRDLVAKVLDKEIVYDISFGGSFFGMVDIDKLGIEIIPENIPEITKIGMAMLDYVNKNVEIKHPELDITSVDLIEFYSHKATDGADLRNVVIFGDGMADRSPCGTGCSAKVAQLVAKGELQIGEKITSQSFIGSKFIACPIEKTKVGEFDAVIPQVTGSASVMSMGTYIICKDDNIKYGFSVE